MPSPKFHFTNTLTFSDYPKFSEIDMSALAPSSYLSKMSSSLQSLPSSSSSSQTQVQTQASSCSSASSSSSSTVVINGNQPGRSAFFWKTQPAASATLTVTEKYAYFWKPESVFSNWRITVFYLADGVRVNCGEMALMYAKAKLFKDYETAALILAADDPKELKALGRKVRNFDERIWFQHRERIVTDMLMQKFSQQDDYKKALLETEHRVIVETSPYDKIYGIGMTTEEIIKKGENPANWKGLNLLGKCLMTVRATLKGPSIITEIHHCLANKIPISKEEHMAMNKAAIEVLSRAVNNNMKQ